MDKFNELPSAARLGTFIIIGALIFAGAWYGPVPGLAAMRTANAAAASRLKDKQAENAKLKPFEGQLRELNSQIEALERQMERQREIVPDAKDADQFIRDMQSNAQQAGIEIRSFTAKPVTAKQYYSEAPFEIEIDGPYFAVLNFFEKIGTMERIVNIDDLKMSGIGSKATAPTKHKYDYAPGESVLVACTAKTFFSHGSGGADPAPGAKTGAPAASQSSTPLQSTPTHPTS